MKYTFNIQNPLNALQAAATHKGYVIMPQMQQGHSNFLQGDNVEEEDISLNLGGVNLFGRKVVNDMYFCVGADEVALLNAIASVGFVNDIVVTPMAAGRGGVIEGVSIENLAISITGYIGNDKEFSQAYPYDQVNNFHKLFKRGTNFDVSSRYLNLFDINKVVVKNIDYPQQAGGYSNLQYFTMELIQDSDIELIIKEN